MPRRPDGVDRCALCERAVALTFHHLIPRANHGRRWFQRHYDRERMRSDGLWICRLCHDAVHRFFDEQTLGRRLNTQHALLAEPQVQRHVQWARRQR